MVIPSISWFKNTYYINLICIRIGAHIKNIQKYICVIFWNIGLNIVDYRVKKQTEKSAKIHDEKMVENRCCEAPWCPLVSLLNNISTLLHIN